MLWVTVLLSEEVSMGKIFSLWNFVGVLAVTSMDQAFSVMFFLLAGFYAKF